MVATASVKQANGVWREERRTFGTMTGELLDLSDWLVEKGVTHAAMESTGEYTPPIMLPKEC